MKKLLVLIFTLATFSGVAQQEKREKVYESFASPRVLNNHSVEMLPGRTFEFLVAHKFGDLAGSGGGYKNFFGLDNLADVRIAFEFGLTDNMNVGVGRSKGIEVTTQMIDGFFKYRILHQQTSGMPLSLTFVTSTAFTYRDKDSDPTSPASFPTFFHRFRYCSQILAARKFSDRFTLQLNLGYHHRNYVQLGDKNEIAFGGISGRVRITKILGLLGEYNYQFNRPSSIPTQNHLAFGVEILTGGHAFALVLSNSRGLNENIFITETSREWLEGGFRFGFSITRRFKM